MIKKSVLGLLEKEPWLKPLIDLIKFKEISETKYACASVKIEYEVITITVNKRKFQSLFEEEKISVIAHEIGHILSGHLTERAYINADKFLLGLAQDAAINDGLARNYTLPKWFVTPKSLSLESGKSTEQYLAELERIGRKRLSKRFTIPDTESHEHSVSKNTRLIKSIIGKMNLC